ncbi:hypothetical protein [Streptomyces sp. NPDC048516]|uniref:hypothetical protein n=1 Tax=Streptomyces sp. NPDC048516 TaxID=3365565 RepID=UPI0037231683
MVPVVVFGAALLVAVSLSGPAARTVLFTSLLRFGPKGCASVVYGLLVLQSGIPQAEPAFTLIAVCIAFSIIAHSSTDVPIVRALHVEEPAGVPAVHDDVAPRPRSSAAQEDHAGAPC